ncbi:MAG: hypothetical protein PVJ40_02065 [Gammaproteobacteria bacterium]|jgi:hypothetical protein
MNDESDKEPILAIVGEWYRDAHGQVFEVVAVDDDDQTVEIQYFDGTVEEVDQDSWGELGPVAAEPPEDWSGSLDIERADYGVDLEDIHPDDWSNPLDYLDRPH